MKAIILAGGLGTRISEETADKPKPLVSIGDKPILEHLIDSLILQGMNDFIITSGYKGSLIEEWANKKKEKYKNIEIQVLDTGLETQTAGRIAKVFRSNSEERMFVTYGDGLGNIDIKHLLNHHIKNGKTATVTAARPPARFGYLEIKNGIVMKFSEKNLSDVGWINAGYFILERKVLDYIPNDFASFESISLPQLTSMGQLSAYQHFGFWKPMDTLREKNELEKIYLESEPNSIPWLTKINE